MLVLGLLRFLWVFGIIFMLLGDLISPTGTPFFCFTFTIHPTPEKFCASNWFYLKRLLEFSAKLEAPYPGKCCLEFLDWDSNSQMVVLRHFGESILKVKKSLSTTVNVREPNVRFAKPNQIWFGYRWFGYRTFGSIMSVRLIFSGKLDRFIFFIFFLYKTV